MTPPRNRRLGRRVRGRTQVDERWAGSVHGGRRVRQDARWAAAAATAVAVATGCGTVAGPDGSRTTSAEVREAPAAVAPDEVARHGGVCPPRLPEASAAAGEVAGAPPTLPAPGEAWVCVYDAGGGPGAQPGPPGWRQRGRAVAVPDEARGRLAALLDQLAPAAADRVCTMDLGPRLVLTYTGAGERSGDLTAVAVDLFGCRDVRVTSDPFATAPGDLGPQDGTVDTGVVAGVLTGPPELPDLLQSVVSRARP